MRIDVQKVNVLLFVNPLKSDRPFQVVDRTFEFSRLPCVGEYVQLGNDEQGKAADYEVVIVHHLPLRPNDVSAEVYMRRVNMPQEILERRAPIDTNPPRFRRD